LDPSAERNVIDAAAVGEAGHSVENLRFSLLDDADPTRVLRGTIARLIRRDDGSCVVLAGREELELALSAVRRLYPDAVVTGGVIDGHE
jgi:hypothetical protein